MGRGVQKLQEELRDAMKAERVSVPVTRISVGHISEQTERPIRWKFPQSHRRGTSRDVMGSW